VEWPTTEGAYLSYPARRDLHRSPGQNLERLEFHFVVHLDLDIVEFVQYVLTEIRADRSPVQTERRGRVTYGSIGADIVLDVFSPKAKDGAIEVYRHG
jgi:hypothetical protein